MNSNFAVNTEKVTKKFYDGFKKQHIKFIEFMEGVSESVDREWYASIMLNRLMFCYFFQKRGFLDNDRDYLRNRLNQCEQIKGQDQFYSFYKDFLLILFHNGLAEPVHDAELISMIGRVPYLNGGIFDVHFLEKNILILKLMIRHLKWSLIFLIHMNGILTVESVLLVMRYLQMY